MTHRVTVLPNNASEYYDGLNVHYSSGVFNKAFYHLATTIRLGYQESVRTFRFSKPNLPAGKQ
ncbi:M4 family metallopeptidase [Vibrio chagasii]|nr:M4 family metallopeptidase [Vibrio chagasii]